MTTRAYTDSMTTAYNRRTSVYTIRMSDSTRADRLTVAARLPAVADQGDASVSWRTRNDGTALVEAEDATAGIPAAWSLETGLGIHRRLVHLRKRDS